MGELSASRFGERSWQAVMVLVALVAAGIVTRLPFRAEILHHWDSVNFALAMEKYDVGLHQPHPPGTFVIYVMLGRLIDLFVKDANASLVWLSVVSGALGVGALFWLGRRRFGWQVGLTAALLALTSPLVWFHGEVALSYAPEFLWVAVTVLFCFDLDRRRWRPLLVSALLIGLSGGVRPNTPFFLFPLWLGGAILHRYRVAQILAGLAVMAGGAMLWFLPMLVLTGGLWNYVAAMRWWQGHHTSESARLIGLARNLARLGVYGVAGLGLGLVPLIAVTPRFLAREIGVLRSDWRAQAMALWVLPAGAYYILIHVRQSGHVFTIVPAFLLLCALAMVRIARRGPSLQRWLWGAMTAVVVLGNALAFLLTPAHPLGERSFLLTAHSWPAIREYDNHVKACLETIRSSSDPAVTAVLAGGRNFRLPDYYLADYQRTELSYLVRHRPVELEPPVRRLVFFDEVPGFRIPPGVELRTLGRPDRCSVRCVEWEADQTLEVRLGGLRLRGAASAGDAEADAPR